MKIIKVKPEDSFEVDYNNNNEGIVYEIYDGYNRKFYIYSNPGNCKVSTIDYLSYISVDFAVQKITEYFNSLPHYKSVFQCTLSQIKFEKYKEHFTLVHKVEIPIGYGKDCQYFCIFMPKNLKELKHNYAKNHHKRLTKFIEQNG